MSRARRHRPEELAFLAEVARLVGSARAWDELMRTIVDRATAAADAEVCSLYLMDRDGSGVTLAATNGLDPEQVGHARLPLGLGITGRVAQTRQPITSMNVLRDRRFHWIRGVDQLRFTSMCSVPLIWNDEVVGVLNVQTIRRRRFTGRDVRFLETLAGLLAGIVERNRLQREAEAQVESLRAIDEARAQLVTVVTHALRTPLAVVRAYVELLGGAARRSGEPDAAAWERSAIEQVERLDQAVDSILASLRVLQPDTATATPLDMTRIVEETARELAPIFRRQRLATSFLERPLIAVASSEPLRRLLGYLLENAAKYAPQDGTIDIYGWRQEDRVCLAITDDGPGIPVAWRERIFEPFVRLDESTRGAGIGLFAARHIARSMGGDLRAEDRQPRGSQFVLELRAAPQTLPPASEGSAVRATTG
ncbi:MAG: GAF domain-containing protein [Chloroflexota bacterium]|nr:GAF domain-containing protein [Chloroflexota bacterium]